MSTRDPFEYDPTGYEGYDPATDYGFSPHTGAAREPGRHDGMIRESVISPTAAEPVTITTTMDPRPDGTRYETIAYRRRDTPEALELAMMTQAGAPLYRVHDDRARALAFHAALVALIETAYGMQTEEPRA